ncbi:MAG: LysM peptidoglycan-binding domain-containing protein [Anaerolineae bacterium]|nr:MAG: LysM peptidoglycan-binding domain-containing protein [Anaerolineae bacterium]
MSGPFIYVVEEGDTFFSIAERFGVDILVLIEVNRERMNLDPNNPILRVGDEVLVPPAGAQLPTPTALPQDLPPGTRIQYTVQPGDTLGGIALKFNSTVEDILKRNEALADDPNAIFVGQVIEVRVNLVTPVPTSAATQAPQATPGSIATLTPTTTP